MKGKKVFLFLCLFLGFILIVLGVWTEGVEHSAHRSPVYPFYELEGLLKKEEGELSREEYALLSQQTGLEMSGISSLWQQGRQKELLLLQERLYAPVEITCRANTIVSREERITSDLQGLTFLQAFPTVEPGDILISFNCHVLGWRSGHAAMVVDCEKGLSLEARVLGTDTALISLESWLRNPSVTVLRVKGLTGEQRAQVADYAVEQLVGIPYHLLASKKLYEEEDRILMARKMPQEDALCAVLPEGTHCAHLVWSAFRKFGIDLDGDGGWIVTPHDIYESELLEIVQQYGM